MVWTALLPTRPGITTPWLQPNISLNLQPIKFVRKSSSQGISQSWCQGESFPVNACVTDVLDLKQMCHTAVMCCEISIKYIVRHVKELHSPANDPYVVTQPSVPWMPLARSCNYKLFIVPFLFWTNFLLVIVNFIKTAHDIFNLEQYFKNRQPCHYLFFFFLPPPSPSVQALFWKNYVLPLKSQSSLEIHYSSSKGGLQPASPLWNLPNRLQTYCQSTFLSLTWFFVNPQGHAGWSERTYGPHVWGVHWPPVSALCDNSMKTLCPALSAGPWSYQTALSSTLSCTALSSVSSQHSHPENEGSLPFCMEWPLLSLMHLQHGLSQIISQI